MAWAIQKRLPKRQAVLFLLVLTGLGLRMNRQERQLAQRRAEEEHQRQLALFRSDLLSALESVKRQAAAGRVNDAVVLIGAVRDGNLALPY